MIPCILQESPRLSEVSPVSRADHSTVPAVADFMRPRLELRGSAMGTNQIQQFVGNNGPLNGSAQTMPTTLLADHTY